VGIDLGTTNSAAAVFDGERVQLIRSAQGSGLLTPSVVRIDARGKVTVGERARRLVDQDPDNVKSEFKRMMGSQQTIAFPAAGLVRKPEELAAEVLRSIREDVKAQTGILPETAVIGVPALFELPQTAATSEAARLAGFERVEIIQEPVASGLGAGFRAAEDVGSFLVYDLGGGTFDVSLLEAREGLLRVVGHDGDNFLGGRDFDAALVDHFIELIRAQSGVTLQRDNPAHAHAFRRLRVAAEDAKIELSRSTEADVFIADIGLQGQSVALSASVERATFESLVAPLIERTITICERLLQSHGLVGAGSVGNVVLVGGPTSIPALRARVAQALGAPFGEGLDAMTLVAEGAAYYAASSGLDARGSGAKEAGAGAPVWLQFPAMSSDLNPFVVGKLVEASSRERISHVVISRTDGGWASAREVVDPDGTFAIMTNLVARRPNTLRIEGYAPNGDGPLLLAPSEFVIVHGVTLGDPPLARSVGVALANNGVRVFFDRGSPLPMRRTFAVRTVETLSPADPEGSLRIPVVQGEFPYAHLCRLVGAIEIKASSLKSPLPVDSLIEVTIELDRGGRLAASGCIPSTGDVFGHVAQLITGKVVPSELAPRIEELRTRLRDTRTKAFKHKAQKAITVLSSAEAMLDDCAIATQRAQGGDQDAGERAQRLLIDADALIAEGEGEIAWPDLDERARSGLTRWAGWIAEYGTAIERQALEETTRAMEKASLARNAREVRHHLATIAHLGNAAAMRSEGAWESELDYQISQITKSRDPKAAAKLVAEGQRAIQVRDKAALEAAVRGLWELAPGTSDKTRGLGHWSGVT
jgi:molecular chaperone DnaK